MISQLKVTSTNGVVGVVSSGLGTQINLLILIFLIIHFEMLTSLFNVWGILRKIWTGVSVDKCNLIPI